MLIQQAEKKENSCSKRYEMSKWSFSNAILMTDWNTVDCHIACTLLVLKLIYASLPMCVCYF